MDNRTCPTPVGEAHPLPGTSLIICSRNRPDSLLRAVETILAGEEVPKEILILDQSDVQHPILATMAPWRGCEIRYLRPGVAGLSRANNLGVAAAREDILVFTHDDALVTPTWLGTLVRALVAEGRDSVVTGRVLPTAPEFPGGFILDTMVRPDRAVYVGRIDHDPLIAMNNAFYRQVAARIGPFDPRLGAGARFPAADDNDFGYRLLMAGYRIVYVPDAVVYHRAWRPASEYLAQRWAYGVGLGAFYAKHLARRDFWMVRRLYRDLKHTTFVFPDLVRRDRGQAWGAALAALGEVCGAVAWFLTSALS